MDNFSIKDFEKKDIEYSLNEYNFDEKTLYIAPIKFSNDNPVYMADALGFYQNVDKIGGINAEILVKRERYTRLTYDFVSIYLGIFIGVGLFAFGHFLYDLLNKKKKIYPNEDIHINFKYLDVEEGKVYEYSGDFSELKKLTPDILQKIAPLLEEDKEGSSYELWMYAQKQIAKKTWKSLFRYLRKIDLTFFSADIFRNETVFNEEIYKILREKFPNVKMNELISGRIHVDVSETKIAIEIKKLESNTPKDELIGQIKEDLRIGTYNYGIIFGIDYTSNKDLTKYNELIFEDGKVYCIIKPYPY